MAATIEYYQGLSQELNHVLNTVILKPIKALFESMGIQVDFGRMDTSKALPTDEERNREAKIPQIKKSFPNI